MAVISATIWLVGCTPSSSPSEGSSGKQQDGSKAAVDSEAANSGLPMDKGAPASQAAPPKLGEAGEASPDAPKTEASPKPDASPDRQAGQAGATGDSPRGSGGGRGGTNFAFLLNNDQIKKELGISEQQAAKIQALLPQRGSGGGANSDLSPEERQKQRQELQAKVMAALSEPQKTRIQEIQYQLKGPRAFSNADVEQALGITAAQTEKIDAILPGRGGFGGGGNRGRGDDRA